MALAPGSSGASVRWLPSYTAVARSPPSHCGHMLGAPVYLGFRVDGECRNPSFANYYYEDVEEDTPPSYSPGAPSPPSQCGLMLGDPFPPSFGGRRGCHNPSSADHYEEDMTPSYTPGAPSPPSHYGLMLKSTDAAFFPGSGVGSECHSQSSVQRNEEHTPSSPPPLASSKDCTPSSPLPSPGYTPSDTESCTSPYYTPSTPTPSTPAPSPLVSEAESSTSAPRRRHHPYQRSGASRINRGGRQQTLRY
ncbi:hypothetical protein CFC21_034141 [Triticum aestivum]|uniref:Uncharacterized protein n=2 Tax=Triticum aestivum TaxID=4565 RepID=A0A3B6ED66_WHEAT|nr:hypothetical protein CFC21_034141 [Triticum aestivum]